MAKKKVEPKTKSWFEVKNESGTKATIRIYDVIGGWDIDAASFANQFNSLEASEVDLLINSPGGSVFDGMAIYNTIKNSTKKVSVYVDGLAASIASVIAMGGDTVTMRQGSLMMIHNPWVCTMGSAKELRKDADALEKIAGNIVDVYRTKSGLDVDELQAAMDAETWYNPAEAKDIGFADFDDTEDEDEVGASARLVAAAAFDLGRFVNVPAALAQAVSAEPDHDDDDEGTEPTPAGDDTPPAGDEGGEGAETPVPTPEPQADPAVAELVKSMAALEARLIQAERSNNLADDKNAPLGFVGENNPDGGDEEDFIGLCMDYKKENNCDMATAMNRMSRKHKASYARYLRKTQR